MITPPWPPSGTSVRAFVLVNESAGSVGKGARDALLSIVAEVGAEVIAVREDVSDLAACRREAFKADVIIVLGGDGTARAAAEAFSAGPPLILLPGGTLNILPHALYGERNWQDALRDALKGGRVVRLVGGKANGKKFFVAGLFGPPTLLARARESVRKGHFLEALRRFDHAFRRMFSRPMVVHAEGSAVARVEGVGVLCPAYAGEIQDSALEWVQLDVTRVTEFIRVGLRSVIGGWRDDDTIELSRARRGEIRSRGVIPAVLDGEPTTFLSRVKIEILSNGPRVVALD
ncbi:MAG TPA: diacylglycerol kinase family protein [Caulobacterales bacterium]|nr:diacylglycerol kinase family protein [Caulobacterales bacterium]